MYLLEIGFIEQYQYHTLGPLRCFEYNNLTSNMIQCASGYQVEYKHRCLLEYDERGDVMGCKDVSHIQNCRDFQCKGNQYSKCPNR